MGRPDNLCIVSALLDARLQHSCRYLDNEGCALGMDTQYSLSLQCLLDFRGYGQWDLPVSACQSYRRPQYAEPTPLSAFVHTERNPPPPCICPLWMTPQLNSYKYKKNYSNLHQNIRTQQNFNLRTSSKANVPYLSTYQECAVRQTSAMSQSLETCTQLASVYASQYDKP